MGRIMGITLNNIPFSGCLCKSFVYGYLQDLLVYINHTYTTQIDYAVLGERGQILGGLKS